MRITSKPRRNCRRVIPSHKRCRRVRFDNGATRNARRRGFAAMVGYGFFSGAGYVV